MEKRGIIIGVLQSKGGAGKSTITENIAVGIARSSVSVAIIDCDCKQRTSSKWVARRNEYHPELPKIHCFLESDNIITSINEHAKHYDVTIVDVQGRDNKALRAGFLICDIIYIPFVPSQNDLESIDDIALLIKETELQNPNRKIFAILNACSAQSQNAQSNNAYEFLGVHADLFRFSNVKIAHRVIYQTCPSEGLGVLESKDQKAQFEITKLIKEIRENV